MNESSKQKQEEQKHKLEELVKQNIEQFRTETHSEKDMDYERIAEFILMINPDATNNQVYRAVSEISNLTDAQFDAAYYKAMDSMSGRGFSIGDIQKAAETNDFFKQDVLRKQRSTEEFNKLWGDSAKKEKKEYNEEDFQKDISEQPAPKAGDTAEFFAPGGQGLGIAPGMQFIQKKEQPADEYNPSQQEEYPEQPAYAEQQQSEEFAEQQEEVFEPDESQLPQPADEQSQPADYAEQQQSEEFAEQQEEVFEPDESQLFAEQQEEQQPLAENLENKVEEEPKLNDNLIAYIASQIKAIADKEKQEVPDIDGFAYDIGYEFHGKGIKTTGQVTYNDVAEAINSKKGSYFSPKKHITSIFKKPGKKTEKIENQKSGMFRWIMYMAFMGVLGAAAYFGIKNYSPKPAEDSKYVSKTELSSEISSLKSGLGELITENYSQLKQDIPKMPDVPAEVEKAVAPVKEAQEQMKQESAAQYEENKNKISELKQSLEESAEKQGEYAANQEKKLDDYQKSQSEEIKKIAEAIADSNKAHASSIENLEKKIDSSIKENEKKLQEADTKYATLKDINNAAQKAVEDEDRKKREEERKIEESSGLFTNFIVDYARIAKGISTTSYSTFDNSGNPVIEKDRFSIAEAVFGLNGKIGARQIYSVFDFNAKQGSTEGKDNDISGKWSNYTLFLGAGGSYPLSDNNKNIFSWSGGALFRNNDSETDLSGFSNEKDGEQKGYKIRVAMDRMKNWTSFWISYEKADGESESTTLSSGFEPYILKLDTKTETFSAGIETAIARFATGASLETAAKKYAAESEGAFGFGAGYKNTKNSEGDSKIESRALETYLFIDLFDNGKKDRTGLRLKAGAVWENYDIDGNVDEKRNNPRGFFGGEIRF